MGGAGGIADRGQLYMGAPPYWCSRYTFANEASHLRCGILGFNMVIHIDADILINYEKQNIYTKLFSAIKFPPL